MLTMVHLSFGIATVLYGFAGIGGDSYQRCTGGDVTPNVLNMFHADDVVANVGRALLTLVLLFSLPLLCLPCRVMLHRLLHEHCCSPRASRAAAATEGLGAILAVSDDVGGTTALGGSVQASPPAAARGGAARAWSKGSGPALGPPVAMYFIS